MRLFFTGTKTVQYSRSEYRFQFFVGSNTWNIVRDMYFCVISRLSKYRFIFARHLRPLVVKARTRCEQTDRQADRQGDSYIFTPKLCLQGVDLHRKTCTCITRVKIYDTFAEN